MISNLRISWNSNLQSNREFQFVRETNSNLSNKKKGERSRQCLCVKEVINAYFTTLSDIWYSLLLKIKYERKIIKGIVCVNYSCVGYYIGNNFAKWGFFFCKIRTLCNCCIYRRFYFFTPLYNFIHDNQMTKALISEPSQEYLILL